MWHHHLKYILDLVEWSHDTEQEPIHHPEGSVRNHLLQTFHHAARESIDLATVLAALTHDVGKMVERRGHEKHSVALLSERVPHKTIWLVENHMRIKKLLSGEMAKLSKVRALLEHPWLPSLIALHRWDYLGRRPHAKTTFDRGRITEILMSKSYTPV